MYFEYIFIKTSQNITVFLATYFLNMSAIKNIAINFIDSIQSLFASGLTPGTAYKEFLRDERSSCIDKMKYYRVLADRSKVPRRQHFYIPSKTMMYLEANV